jgi:hypothetical protein
MLNFTFILYSLLFFVLFLFLGLGLTVLFCPKELLKYAFFLSPIIGYCLLISVGWYFYHLNFKGTDDYYYWILLTSLLFLIAALIKIWKQRILTNLFSRELIIPILISVIVFLSVAVPSLRQERMTSSVIGNNDIAQYALDSKIVKELPKDDWHNTIFQVVEPILGGFMNTAFFCSVVKLDPYQVQNISLYIFFIISLLLTYILGREFFNYSSFASNVIILLYGLNSVSYYVIYNGFENQVIAVPLMLMILLSNVAIIRANRFEDRIRYLPFLCLAVSGLSLNYSHMLVIIYGLVIPYVLVSSWKNGKVAKILNWAAINCIAALIIVCLYPQRLQMIASETFSRGSEIRGWYMPLTTPDKLYGVASYLSPSILIVTIAVTIFLVVLIISGFIKLYRKDIENFLFSSTLLLLIFIGALILSLLNMNIPKANHGGFGGYKQFKLISFFIPVILLTSFALFRDMTFNIRNLGIRSNLFHRVKSSFEYLKIRRNTLSLLLIAGLIIATSISAGAMIYTSTKNSMAIPSATIDLQGIRNFQEIKSINIPAGESGSYWDIMWEAYFLFPKKLFFEQSTYYASSPLDGEWFLIRNAKESTEKVLSVLRKIDRNAILINSTYALSKGAPSLTVKFGEGWSDDEGSHRWTISDDASIIIDSLSEKVLINLVLDFKPLNNENSIAIYLNGAKIINYNNSSNSLIKDLLLNKGKNIIKFKAKLQGELPGNGDPRKLCYAFKFIRIVEAE